MNAGFKDEIVDESTHVVAVTGELDMTSIRDLRSRVDRALADGRSRLVVDLDGVTHLDSSGLAELIGAHQGAARAGGGLVLVVGSQQIRRTLDIRGLRDIFAIAASREEAFGALR